MWKVTLEVDGTYTRTLKEEESGIEAAIAFGEASEMVRNVDYMPISAGRTVEVVLWHDGVLTNSYIYEIPTTKGTPDVEIHQEGS